MGRASEAGLVRAGTGRKQREQPRHLQPCLALYRPLSADPGSARLIKPGLARGAPAPASHCRGQKGRLGAKRLRALNNGASFPKESTSEEPQTGVAWDLAKNTNQRER